MMWGRGVGNFIAEVENDKFFFSVKTDGGENEAFDANYLSFQIILQREVVM